MKQYLTDPPHFKNQYDNEKDDLVVCRDDVLSRSEHCKYIVEDILGTGTFGQVFRCRVDKVRIDGYNGLINDDGYRRVHINKKNSVEDGYSNDCGENECEGLAKKLRGTFFIDGDTKKGNKYSDVDLKKYETENTNTSNGYFNYQFHNGYRELDKTSDNPYSHNDRNYNGYKQNYRIDSRFLSEKNMKNKFSFSEGTKPGSANLFENDYRHVEHKNKRQHVSLVAVKIIKNNGSFFKHGISEVHILSRLTEQHSNIFSVFHDAFIFKNHLCIVMELLGKNLYEVLQLTGFRGFEHSVLKNILKQILKALEILNKMGIVHCDIKPENILVSDLRNIKIKLIDFGNAVENSTGTCFYVQSRYYRAPEVILGMSYDCGVDVWSLGCLAYELFVGSPLFPGCDNAEMIGRMTCCLGEPPYFMIEYGVNSAKYNYRTGCKICGKSKCCNFNGNDNVVSFGKYDIRNNIYGRENINSDRNEHCVASDEEISGISRSGERTNEQEYTGMERINQTNFGFKNDSRFDDVRMNSIDENSSMNSEYRYDPVIQPNLSCGQIIRNKILYKEGNQTENNNFYEFIMYILKINFLERPSAFSCSRHFYLAVEEKDVRFELHKEDTRDVVRNQPNPAPGESHMRRYSMAGFEPLVGKMNKYREHRKKSAYQISVKNNRKDIESEKENSKKWIKK